MLKQYKTQNYHNICKILPAIIVWLTKNLNCYVFLFIYKHLLFLNLLIIIYILILFYFEIIWDATQNLDECDINPRRRSHKRD